jgi:hypothetical protein
MHLQRSPFGLLPSRFPMKVCNSCHESIEVAVREHLLLPPFIHIQESSKVVGYVLSTSSLLVEGFSKCAKKHGDTSVRLRMREVSTVQMLTHQLTELWKRRQVKRILCALHKYMAN